MSFRINITADRLTTLWAYFATFVLRESNELITPGELELLRKKSDVRVDTTKWFWNGEQCCNPWLQRT